MDRLRRPDNGGGNGVYASRRYVLLDRHAARAGGRAHLSLAVPGEPCLPASGTLQDDLPGLLLDCVRVVLGVKEALLLQAGELPIVYCRTHASTRPNKPLRQANVSNSIDPGPPIVQVFEEAGRMQPNVAAIHDGAAWTGGRRGGPVRAAGWLSGLSDSRTCTV